MLVSELIKKLKKKQESEGDIPVKVAIAYEVDDFFEEQYLDIDEIENDIKEQDLFVEAGKAHYLILRTE